MNKFFLLSIILLLTGISGIYCLNQPEMVIQMGHSASITSLCFSHNGNYILSGSYDGTVKLWHTKTGKLIRTFGTSEKNRVMTAVFSPDDSSIAAGCMGSAVIELWNLETGERNGRFLTDSTGTIFTLAYSRDGRYLAAGGDAWGGGRGITVFEIPTGKKISSFETDVFYMEKLIFDTTGNLLYSAGEYRGPEESRFRAIQWDIKTGKNLKTLHISSDRVSFTPDGLYMLSLEYGGALTMTDMKTMKQYKSTRFTSMEDLLFTFSPDYAYTVIYDLELKIMDFTTGKRLHSLQQGSFLKNTIAISPDSTQIISGGDDFNPHITMWDLKTGHLLRRFSGQIYPVFSLDYLPENRLVLFGDTSYKNPHIWDLETLTLSSLDKKNSLYKITHTPDEKKIITASDTITCRETKSKAVLWSFLTESSDLAVSPDGRYFAICNSPPDSDEKKKIRLYDTDTGKLIREQQEVRYPVLLSFLNKGKTIITAADILHEGKDDDYYTNSISLFDSNTGNTLWSQESSDRIKIEHLAVSPDGNYCAFILREKELWETEVDEETITHIKYSYRIEVWDFHNGEFSGIPYTTGNLPDYPTTLAFTPDGKHLLTGMGGSIRFLEWKPGKDKLIKQVKEMGNNLFYISKLIMSPDGNALISGSSDGTVRFWDVNTGGYVAFLSDSAKGEWLIFTHDGYWDSSGDGGDMIAMVRGTDIWNIDQFAAKNNRPDIILKRLGSKNKELINHFYNQYLKRLSRLGLKENQLQVDYTIPEALITSSRIDGKHITLDLGLSDPGKGLKSYNIYINDVPLFGPYGKPITGKQTSVTEMTELTSGPNKIEVSCLNMLGSESYRAVMFADYLGTVKGDLYFIGFGVSHYKDKHINTLRFSGHDIHDTEMLCKKMGDTYGTIHTATYIDDDVTVASIRKAKTLLSGSSPDDTLILMISGHGLHDTDKEATYYFLTHDTDLDNLSGTAADFSLVEELLHGIPPRKKLFLMDTCGSGEIDETIVQTSSGVPGEKGIISRSPYTENKGVKIRKNRKLPRTYLNDTDRFIYNDLLRRSGAVVFSSCKGGEVSYENEKYKNGIFTEWLLRAFQKNGGDKNRDGSIDIDELKTYLISQVVTETETPANGYPSPQHPTVDRDNIYLELLLPVTE
ncbi:MAG: caspase family protein [Spirochaetales bacterium]|nr:caspase family protein [Spirochaetales bacterium]